jgi:hypothetical protein
MTKIERQVKYGQTLIIQWRGKRNVQMWMQRVSKEKENNQSEEEIDRR